MLFLLATLPLPATVVLYSNFGPGYTTGNNIDYVTTAGSGYFYGTAEEFQPSQTTALSAIQILLAHDGNETSAIVNIAEDDSGMPGTILESFTTATPYWYPPPDPLTSLTSLAMPQLQAGTTYWLEVLATGTSDGGTYIWGECCFVQPFAYSFDGSTWTSQSSRNAPNYAFEIDGAGSPVPEPGTVYEALGGGLMLAARWRVWRRP
jgi:hypothetical protein